MSHLRYIFVRHTPHKTCNFRLFLYSSVRKGRTHKTNRKVEPMNSSRGWSKSNRYWRVVYNTHCLLPLNKHCLLPVNKNCLLPLNKHCLLPVNKNCLLSLNKHCLLPVNKNCLVPPSKNCLVPLRSKARRILEREEFRVGLTMLEVCLTDIHGRCQRHKTQRSE